MIRDHTLQEIQPEQRHLRQDAALIRDSRWQDVVESRDTVRCHDEQAVAVLVDVPYFSSGKQPIILQIAL